MGHSNSSGENRLTTRNIEERPTDKHTTSIHKTLHRKLKIEQQKLYQKCGVITGSERVSRSCSGWGTPHCANVSANPVISIIVYASFGNRVAAIVGTTATDIP